MEDKMTEKDRIEQVMQAEKLNSAQFAAEIGIKSSTLSHILNGRNNPSLDVLKKVLDRYRTISSDWLILGIGQMHRSGRQSQTLSLFDNLDENSSKSVGYDSEKSINLQQQKVSIQEKSITETEKNIKQADFQPVAAKSVAKIIVYYDDNTFQEFLTK